jgi:hypothetical protein
VVYDLPVDSPLDGLRKSDAQRIIYSSIIRSLIERGFEVKIFLKDDIARLYIAWSTSLGTEEISAMNTMIVANSIQDNEIDSFIRGEGSAPPTTIAKQIGRPEKNAAADPAAKPRPADTAIRARPAGLSAAEADILSSVK